MKWTVAILAAPLAFIRIYRAVAYISCIWLWPESNLCGILAPPSALIAAVLVFWLIASRRPQRSHR